MVIGYYPARAGATADNKGEKQMANNVFITIDKQWFEKNKAQASKDYKEMFDDDDLQSGYKFDIEDAKVTISADSAQIQWDFSNPDDDDAPFVSVEFDIGNEDWIKLAEMVIKRLNKGKALMEALQD